MDVYRTKNDKSLQECLGNEVDEINSRFQATIVPVAETALSGCWRSRSLSQCPFLSDKGPICVFQTLLGIATMFSKWRVSRVLF